MHFNFHLSGDESPEQSRRIANAVLALGGLLSPSEGCEFVNDTTGTVANYDEFGGNIALAERKPILSMFDHTVESLAHKLPPNPPVFLDPSEIPTHASHVEPGTLPTYETTVQTVPLPPTLSVAESTSALTDKNGLPWDDRIHSSSRAINADGTWRYRKNVPDETKRDVEAELRGLVQTTPVAPPVPVILPPGSTLYVTPPSADPMVPGLVPPAPPVPTGALQRTYSDVVNLIMSRKVQPDTYVAILGMSLPEFAKHVISAPNDATLMFDALDQASRP